MNEEQVYNQFMTLVTKVGQMTPFEQAFNGPRIYMDFFKGIYDDGYIKGFEKATIKLKNELAKKN
jgi:hypothetical protein